MQNRIDRESTNLKFISILCLLCCGIVFCKMWDKPDVTSLLFSISFIVQIVWFVSNGVITPNHRLLISILFFTGISLMISVISCGFTAISFSKMSFLFSFFGTITYLYLVSTVECTYKIRNTVIVYGIITASLYPICYRMFAFNTNNYLFDMNFGNANSLGIFILQSIMYTIVCIICFRSKILKLLCIILMVINGYFLYCSECRTAELAVVFSVIAVAFVILFKKRNVKFERITIILVNIIPFIFIFYYLNNIDALASNPHLAFLVDEGKAIESRYSVWLSAFRYLDGHYIFGNYFELCGNWHNSYLTVWCSYGAIVLLLTMIFVYKTIMHINEECTSWQQVVCIACFFATLFMGIGEGAFFSGGTGLHICACNFLLLAKYDYRNSIGDITL